MKFADVRTIAAKLLRGISYSSVLLQWLWMSVIVVPPLIKSGAFDGFNMPAESQAPTIATEPLAASPLVWTIVGIVTLVILVITLIILLRLPRVVTEAGDQVVQQAAKAVLPTLTHHKRISAKKQRVLSRRLTLVIQLLAAFIPAVASFFLPAFNEITPEIIVTLALLLASVSVTGFVVAWFVEPTKKPTSRTQSRAFRG